MTQEQIEEYKVLMKRIKIDPLFFIFKMWNLTPQKIKEEFKPLVEDLISKDNYIAVRPEYFEQFNKGTEITWQQYLIFKSIERGIRGLSKKKISIRSGHGIGKTSTFSMFILWYLFSFLDAQIPCTAPTSEQMHDALWKEVYIWLYKMPTEIKELYDWKSEKISMKAKPETWFARARTARKEAPEALAGIHADNVAILVDEASGVPNEIFNTAQGSLTNDNVLFIMISNPTRLEGYFYDSFNKLNDIFVNLWFNSEESPIVNKQFVNDIIRRHGIDSDEYRIRVKGEFPKASTLDNSGYVNLFEQNELKFRPTSEFVGSIKLGIDCAGEGKDKTRWVARDDFKARLIASEDMSTSKSIAERTLTLMQIYGIRAESIYIDNFGVGANVAMEIARSGNFPNGINVGDESSFDDTDNIYINLRSEGAFKIKKWIRNGGELCESDKWEDLMSIKWKRNEKGKIKLMSKQDMRKNGYRSPDVFDALLLTFVDDVDNLEELKEKSRIEQNREKYKTNNLVNQLYE